MAKHTTIIIPPDTIKINDALCPLDTSCENKTSITVRNPCGVGPNSHNTELAVRSHSTQEAFNKQKIYQQRNLMMNEETGQLEKLAGCRQCVELTGG